MIILISGGTGLIGAKLADQLHANGHEVRVLTRSLKKSTHIKFYVWDYAKELIDLEALQGVEVLVHLAGEGIADKKWTPSRKKQILDSRISSLKFLKSVLPNTVHSIIGGSAIGYYGGDTGEIVNTEKTGPGSDFLAYCTKLWETETSSTAQRLKTRCVLIRTSVVLSMDGGAFPKLLAPIKLFAGSALGTGKQWISWIHEADLVGIFVKSIENRQIEGIVNAVSPNPIRNEDLGKAIAIKINRPFILPNVPVFALKMLLGEMSVVVLGSSKVENTRSEFSFKFPDVDSALGALLT